MLYWGTFTRMDIRVADITEDNFGHVFPSLCTSITSTMRLTHHSTYICSPWSSFSIIFPSFIYDHIKNWEKYLSYLSTHFYSFRCSPSLYLHYISKVNFYNVRGSPVFRLFSFCLENFSSCLLFVQSTGSRFSKLLFL